MRESKCKWSKWQRINFQNRQTVHATQYQKTKKPIKKWAEDLNRHFSKEDTQVVINTWNTARHRSLLEKSKSRLQWGIYHLTAVPVAITKKSTSNRCWRGGGEKRALLHCWRECEPGFSLIAVTVSCSLVVVPGLLIVVLLQLHSTGPGAQAR